MKHKREGREYQVNYKEVGRACINWESTSFLREDKEDIGI